MAGYHEYSMSINAMDAYERGLKPLSKWTKADIITLINGRVRDDVLEVAKKMKASDLRDAFLEYREWHHTSNHFNRTDFYGINEACAEYTVEDLARYVTVKEVVTERKAHCRFLEWSGTRKHPKATEREATGTIKGNWFYLDNGTKKSINANGFAIVEYL